MKLCPISHTSAIGFFALIVSFSGSSYANDIDTCYMKTQSGAVVLLDKLCRPRNHLDANHNGMGLKPGEFLIKPDGSWIVAPGGPKPVKLPDGTIVYPDARVQFPFMEGFSMKSGKMTENGKSLPEQYYRPDGSPMNPGEFYKLSSGETIEQKGVEPK